MRRLAERYGNEIRALEVWNEPDQSNELYFAGPNKPERYAALLKAAYVAVKQADPNIAVLAGSLVGVQGGFLKALYQNGIQGYYDGLSVHFYTLTLAAHSHLPRAAAAATATPPRCGSTSSAGPAAIRDRSSSRNRRASRPPCRRATSAACSTPSAGRATWRR